MIVSLTDCNDLYSIKGEGGRLLGYALPGDLFLGLSAVEFENDIDEAVQELNKYYERKCWLMTEEGNEHHRTIAQRAGFFWLSHGVWFRSDFND